MIWHESVLFAFFFPYALVLFSWVCGFILYGGFLDFRAYIPQLLNRRMQLLLLICGLMFATFQECWVVYVSG